MSGSESGRISGRARGQGGRMGDAPLARPGTEIHRREPARWL